MPGDLRPGPGRRRPRGLAGGGAITSLRLTPAAFDGYGRLREETGLLLKTLRRRTGRRLEYAWILEFAARAHVHVLVRTPVPLAPAAVEAALDALGEHDLYCRPMYETPEALTRYFAKHMESKKARLAPADFTGRLFSFSRNFVGTSFRAAGGRPGRRPGQKK